MKICLIAALDRKGVIGTENKLPWNLPEDLKRFRALTSGKPIIMGRKTFESIGRPLPNRHNIVITKNRDFRAFGVQVVHSPDRAVDAAMGWWEAQGVSSDTNPEIWVIGGAEIYRLFLPIADRIALTHVDADVTGDAFFPKWTEQGFQPEGDAFIFAGGDHPARQQVYVKN